MKGVKQNDSLDICTGRNLFSKSLSLKPESEREDQDGELRQAWARQLQTEGERAVLRACVFITVPAGES